MSSWLGLDAGEKRVGIALAEVTTGIATPLVTLEIRGRQHLLDELLKIIKEYSVTKIVVGLPKTLKGEIGPSAQKVLDLVEWLKAFIDCSWILWDERLSTQEVERILLSADVSRGKRKQVRDQLAAQRILQSYIDSRPNRSVTDE